MRRKINGLFCKRLGDVFVQIFYDSAMHGETYATCTLSNELKYGELHVNHRRK